MAALQEFLDEMARIKQELQRMEDDGETTEEADGDLRDTLLSRWEELDAKSKPLILRMEKIRDTTRAAADPGNLEAPDGTAPAANGNGYGNGRYGTSGPDLVVRSNRDPYDCQDVIRSENQILMRRSELRARALDAVELEVKRGNMLPDYAEITTRKVEQGGYFTNNNIARHILMTGSEEYQESFREYLEDPQGNAQRAALSLTLANGGFVTVAAA